MIYDRIYQVAGEVEVFSLMTNLARALGDRVTLLAIVKADTSKGSQLSMEVGMKYQPDLYWKPLSIGPLATSSEADTSKGSQLSMEVGMKYQPDLYWKPLSIG